MKRVTCTQQTIWFHKSWLSTTSKAKYQLLRSWRRWRLSNTINIVAETPVSNISSPVRASSANSAIEMKYFLKVKINLSQSQKYLIPKYNEIHLFFYGKIHKMSRHQNAINLSPKGEFLRTHRVGPICLSALFYFVYCSNFFYPEDLSRLFWW